MASPPTPSPHDRSRPEDENDPVEQMILRTGCANLHYALQDCMAEHQDWRKCQTQVKDFKDCMTSYQNVQKARLLKQRPSESDSKSQLTASD
ncbi:cytochrome c oxidase assembly factor 4 homolog, mitochondrial [Astyanax mexicanus]|uniref:Cytochrome c oxidase assembly factor 4 homolog, mitochondrial n=1 Tax=Astyanax mexicanus TaxID=7994 RepID=W5K721_ASTMX|nr:cytochrome c oxidase assembly factor 4 homolog, mitochondrial [Astyanax mexicanus]XP_022536799.1 cytochrome c oxidase assembly factor 4 homolog, mitochondrial [Astyanax mexicanus]XP_049325006.1 cytochrome c oxidase assembly factor 4 homolog, mitochondrial [Astyanax mexicanus]XP_049325007.1 cytochrome c oxidase assembly factor 4 homolog, mitochondrial [Astyanax mexicanus]